MNKRIRHQTNITDPAARFGTVLSVIFFICGILIGTFSAGSIDDSGSAALYGGINKYIELIESGSFVRADFLSSLYSTYKYHILVIFFGLSIPGFIIIPFVSGIKGFYLSFSIAVFVRVFGTGGALTGFGLFGLTSLISVPCLLLISAESFSTSLNLYFTVTRKSRGGNIGGFGKMYFARCGVYLAVLFLAVLIEIYVTPWFVSAVSVFLQ